MDKDTFLAEMQEVLQRDDPLSMDMPLKDIEEWDSLAVMATAAFLHHNFSVRLTMDDFKTFTIIGDIAIAAGISA